ncbi:MAG TPA: hypothetical protein VMV09_07030 [Candidatus Saccharimonadales bacterium]|nr:hypothetical protein [Candidatus Saccharimonadales bacterium]
MIKVAEVERIRWGHYREGVSVQAPALEFGRSRWTIGGALVDPGRWEYRRQRRRPWPVLGPVAKAIEGRLKQDQGVPRKQRHTAHRLYECLVAEYGFQGAESSVRRWVGAPAAGGRDADAAPGARLRGGRAVRLRPGAGTAGGGGAEAPVVLFPAGLLEPRCGAGVPEPD